MVNSKWLPVYRALESVSMASALSTALYHIPMTDTSPSTLTALLS